MKKILFFLLLVPSLSYADRLGSLNSNAQVLLSTQAVAGGGTPGTPTESIQINGGGVFIGTAALTMNTTSNSLIVGATTTFTSVSTTTWTNVQTLNIDASSTNFTGAVNFSSAPISSIFINRFSTGIPSPSYRFQDYLNRNGSDVNRYRLREFTTVRQVNNAITGAVGASGATYIPEVDLMLVVDNNDLSFHVMDAARVSSPKLGEVALSGFTDPEALEYLWTLYDSSAQPIGCVLAISEEQTNHIILSTWSFANVNGTITKANCTIILPRGMWTPDATLGMEALTYNPFTNEIYAAKQGTNMEFRVIPLDGTFNPQAYEPFDAETLWSSSFTRINDLTFDPNTRTVIGIGDETGASNANQDIFRFNPQTGVLIEWWDNFVTDLGFNTTTWPQSEGIAITPDGKNLYVTSEGADIAWLTNISTGGGSGVGVTGSTGSITIAYDGGGSALVSGSTRCVTVPYSCTVSSWTLVADQSGSMAVHVASSTFDNYPTLSNMSGFGNGPSVSSLQKRANNTTIWTGTTIGAGSQVCGVLDSASTITSANIVLWVIK